MSDVTSYVEVAKNAYKSSVRFSATLVRANIYEDLKVSSVWSWDSLAASRKVKDEQRISGKQIIISFHSRSQLLGVIKSSEMWPTIAAAWPSRLMRSFMQ